MNNLDTIEKYIQLIYSIINHPKNKIDMVFIEQEYKRNQEKFKTLTNMR